MRRALGDGYVDAVRQVFKGVVPDSADFVMYWWHTAAEKVRNNNTLRFGFITTNSLKQTFNRRVLEPHLNDGKKPLSLTFAVPDHPWVDGNDGAAVRIAMTVGAPGDFSGQLRLVTTETSGDAKESRNVQMACRLGKIFADLSIGADVASAEPLMANSNISQRGFELGNSGFLISTGDNQTIVTCNSECDSGVVFDYRNGRDLTQRPRGVKVIDLHGLTIEKVREKYPEIYQWLLERVKPEREQNRDPNLRENWWLHRRSRADLRQMLHGVSRYIATVETAKHRLFTFLECSIRPDNKLINIALDTSSHLGILSSRLHTLWSCTAGSRLGVGNDPVYVKSRCFETFPFPELNAEQAKNISELADRIDAHRKKQQMNHSSLTLTSMYNVLEQLRADEELTEKEKAIHQQGLVSVLRELHDDLDRAVFEAYGWSDLAEKLVGRPGATTPLPDKPDDQAEAEEELLMRLVELNKQRAEEESRGIVRWLRPEYQAPNAVQTEVDIAPKTVPTKPEAATRKGKTSFPKAIPDQLRVLREALAERSHTTESLAEMFKRKPMKSVEEGLQSLAAVGVAEFEVETGTWHSL